MISTIDAKRLLVFQELPNIIMYHQRTIIRFFSNGKQVCRDFSIVFNYYFFGIFLKINVDNNVEFRNKLYNTNQILFKTLKTFSCLSKQEKLSRFR